VPTTVTATAGTSAIRGVLTEEDQEDGEAENDTECFFFFSNYTNKLILSTTIQLLCRPPQN
jgi:hypothetical protein